jgi:hypothetical protein
MSAEEFAGELGDGFRRIMVKATDTATERAINKLLDMKPANENQPGETPGTDVTNTAAAEGQQAGTPGAGVVNMPVIEDPQTAAQDTGEPQSPMVVPVTWLRKNVWTILITSGALAGVASSVFHKTVPNAKKVEIVSVYLANKKEEFPVPITEMNGYREVVEFRLDTALKTKDGGKQENSHRVLSIETPPGCMYNFWLDNNTRLYLDASSCVSFHWPFGSKGRTVLLEKGQVGVDVQSDDGRNFTIQSNNLTATAGTALFNFSTYDKQEERVSVMSGVISLSGKGKGALRLGNLVANKELSWLTQDKKTAGREFDGEELLSWYLYGRRYFNEVTMDEMLQTAERWYGVTIAVEGDVSDIKVKAYLDKRQQIREFLNFLEDKYNIVSNELEEGKVFKVKRK